MKFKCGICGKLHSIEVTPAEMKSLLQVAKLSSDGTIPMACDDCHPFQYSVKPGPYVLHPAVAVAIGVAK